MQYEFEFNVTTYCQAKCKSCVRTILDNAGELKISHSDLSHFYNAVNNINLPPEQCIISLCGELGDPMMHPDIDKIIKIFTDRGFEVNVHTNGGIRNQEFYKELSNNNMVKFFFGIDGINADMNEKYREGVDFDRAFDNMLEWFSHSRRGAWQFIVFEWNKHAVVDAYNIAKISNIPISFIINRREYGFVGFDEIDKLKDLFNELQNRL